MKDILGRILVPAGFVLVGLSLVLFGRAIAEFLYSNLSEDFRFEQGLISKLVGLLLIAFGLALAGWYVYSALVG